MRTSRSSFVRLALLALLASPASAQLAQSSNYQLQAFGFCGGGGGSSTIDTSGFTDIGEIAGGPLSSLRFNAGFGFLSGNDPQPTNAPVVFGLTPDFGPKAGGTSVVISGINFDKYGVSPSVTVMVDGTPLDNMVVQSDTQITGEVPGGAAGPQPVEVSSSLGSASDADGFVYTPAVVTSPIVAVGGTLTLKNYGPVGDDYRTYVALTPTSAGTKFGTLLIGPANITEILMQTPYPLPEGVDTVLFDVPNSPMLHGITVYFQSLSVTNPSPLQGQLTNSCTTTIP